MLTRIGIFLVIAINIFHISFGNEHIYGAQDFGDKPLFEKILFRRDETIPKNFSIIFKYIASNDSPNITYARINVENAMSTGSFDVATADGKERTLQTLINIVNGTDVTVTAHIYGSSVRLFGTNALHSLPSQGNKPKTFTVVYGHNATRTRNQHVIFGQRQHDDKQLTFVTKNATFQYRFAETEIQYRDEHKHITSAHLSFDSPTAIAFVNSTFIKENAISVIAYDFNRPWFIANMTVYGYDDFDKPKSYKPIVLANTKGNSGSNRNF